MKKIKIIIKKKATLGMLAYFLLGIFFLIIFLVGYKALHGKVTDKAEDYPNIEGEEKKIIQPETKLDKQIIEEFDSFIKAIENSKGQSCLVKYNNFFKNDYIVEFTPVEEEKTTKVLLFRKKKGQIDSLDYATLKKKSCVIDAPNFYNKCLIANNCKDPSIIKEVKLKIDDTNIFYVENKAELEDNSIMFQFDETHLCFIPTRDGGLLGTGILPSCAVNDNALNDKCMENIQSKLKYC